MLSCFNSIAAIGDPVGLSDVAQSRGDASHPASVAAVIIRRLHGRDRIAILVPGFWAGDSGERAHGGAG